MIHVSGVRRFRTGSDRKRMVMICCVIFPIIDLGLFVLLKDPVMMVVIGGVMQAVTLPIVGGAAVYLRYRRTDRRLTPGLLWDLFLWLSLIGLIVAAGIGFNDSLKKIL